MSETEDMMRRKCIEQGTRDQYIEAMAAAYCKTTNVPPNECEVVEVTEGLQKRWFIRRREGAGAKPFPSLAVRRLHPKCGDLFVLTHPCTPEAAEDAAAAAKNLSVEFPSMHFLVLPDGWTLDDMTPAFAALKAENAELKAKLTAFGQRWETLAFECIERTPVYAKDGAFLGMRMVVTTLDTNKEAAIPKVASRVLVKQNMPTVKLDDGVEYDVIGYTASRRGESPIAAAWPVFQKGEAIKAAIGELARAMAEAAKQQADPDEDDEEDDDDSTPLAPKHTCTCPVEVLSSVGCQCGGR